MVCMHCGLTRRTCHKCLPLPRTWNLGCHCRWVLGGTFLPSYLLNHCGCFLVLMAPWCQLLSNHLPSAPTSQFRSSSHGFSIPHDLLLPISDAFLSGALLFLLVEDICTLTYFTSSQGSFTLVLKSLLISPSPHTFRHSLWWCHLCGRTCPCSLRSVFGWSFSLMLDRSQYSKHLK